jgi:hypothetical protein
VAAVEVGDALERAAGANDRRFAERRPTNCTAIGSPCAVNAAGSVTVGLPDMSNGAV